MIVLALVVSWNTALPIATGTLDKCQSEEEEDSAMIRGITIVWNTNK